MEFDSIAMHARALYNLTNIVIIHKKRFTLCEIGVYLNHLKAISPRIKTATPVDESALSTFRSKVDLLRKEVCLSSDGIASSVYATIESANVTSALFDVFFGDTPGP
ncbi:hypothetical protein SADUNF_Sadunf11G0062600 [Salix dunnii]|uniref:Uncharacterized protein n=1 Tax=Salix dunnii TaxID=1413687 RepID=A0A835JQE4_9ROSI|nr:hypothetical protein SADUNF_Sadunf11G0062600 [Salix dunnii]